MSPSPRPAPGIVIVAASADAVAVLAFATAGRASHAEGLTIAGIVETAWPFLAALAMSWAISRAWTAPLAVLRSGLPLWIGTVAIGMLLRVWVAGGGAAPAFILVATGTLGLMLVGWRAAAAIVRRFGRDRAPDTAAPAPAHEMC